jgi:cell division protein FtsA
VDHLPSKILLCGGGSSLKQIPEALSKIDWYDDLPFTHKPKVQLVKLDEVMGITNETDSELDHTYITAMGLLRVGHDTISSMDDGDGIMDKIGKMLRV